VFLCYHVKTSSFILEINIQGDQKVSVHLTIAVHSTGTRRLFDHPVFRFTITVGFFSFTLWKRWGMDSRKTAAVLPITEWENVENFCCT